MCEASKALLCTGHLPARMRQISGFAKVSGRLKTIRLAPAIKEGGGLFKPAAFCHMMCRLFETFTLRLYQSGWR